MLDDLAKNPNDAYVRTPAVDTFSDKLSKSLICSGAVAVLVWGLLFVDYNLRQKDFLTDPAPAAYQKIASYEPQLNAKNAPVIFRQALDMAKATAEKSPVLSRGLQSDLTQIIESSYNPNFDARNGFYQVEKAVQNSARREPEQFDYFMGKYGTIAGLGSVVLGFLSMFAQGCAEVQAEKKKRLAAKSKTPVAIQQN